MEVRTRRVGAPGGVPFSHGAQGRLSVDLKGVSLQLPGGGNARQN